MPARTDETPTARDMIQRQALMDDMMTRCGVDLLALIGKDGGQSHAEARSRCRGCSTVKACRDWLLTAGTATPHPSRRISAPIPGSSGILLGE